MSDTTAHSHHHHDPVVHANKEFFNNPDNDIKINPMIKERAMRIAKAILKNYPADKEKTISMDFACGNGIVSKELAPYVKSILGVDVSERMVKQYNRVLKKYGNASAVCVELKGEEGELPDTRFDMIFCAMAYHHLASIEGTTRILASYLQPGGVLIVVDVIHLEEGYAFLPKHEIAVPHKHGVSKDELQKAFDAAGLTMNVYEDIPRDEESTDNGRYFLAVGEKVSA